MRDDESVDNDLEIAEKFDEDPETKNKSLLELSELIYNFSAMTVLLSLVYFAASRTNMLEIWLLAGGLIVAVFIYSFAASYRVSYLLRALIPQRTFPARLFTIAISLMLTAVFVGTQVGLPVVIKNLLAASQPPSGKQ